MSSLYEELIYFDFILTLPFIGLCIMVYYKMKSKGVLFVQISVSKYILTGLFSMDILTDPEILFCY